MCRVCRLLPPCVSGYRVDDLGLRRVDMCCHFALAGLPVITQQLDAKIVLLSTVHDVPCKVTYIHYFILASP